VPELSELSKTLYIPLVGRIYASRHYPSMIHDPKALGLEAVTSPTPLGALVLAAAPPPARASVMVPARTTSRSLPRRLAPSRPDTSRIPPIVPVPEEPPRSPSSPC